MTRAQRPTLAAKSSPTQASRPPSDSREHLALRVLECLSSGLDARLTMEKLRQAESPTDCLMSTHWLRLARMNDCLVSLGSDYEENVHRITALCGELLKASSTLYCRLRDGSVCTIGKWQTPSQLPEEHPLEGYLCSEVVSRKGGGALVIRDLQSHHLADTDPKVRQQGLQTYMGAAVNVAGEPVGVLSMLYQYDIVPDISDCLVLETLAAALAVEERRHLAAEEVLAQETSLMALFEHMREGFVLHEMVGDPETQVPDCKFLAANRAFERQFGLRASDLMERSTKECLPSLHKELLARYARILETGEPGPFELHVESEGRLLSMAAYRPTPRHLACVFTDITEHRRVEAERARMLEALHEAKRTEAIGNLAGGIAHDFNNLLAGLLGCLSLLELDAEPGSSLAQDISEMKASVERGASLTRQLLGFARQGKYAVQPVDLNQLTGKILRVFSSTRRDLTVELALAGSLTSVMADPGQIDQVILNLLVNAGQAMPEGGTLTVRTQQAILSGAEALAHCVSPGPFVILSVKDTGTGMTTDVMSHIFEPFFTTKKAYGGTGLGLASVHGIMRNHGGFVSVESAPGRGSSFDIGLPACDQAPSPEKPRPVAHSRGHETILLVEDEDHVRRTSRRLLEVLGYSVLSARDGSEALAIFQQRPESINLVVLDMVMPRMGGRETFAALRAIDPKVKILLSSGYSLEEQARELLNQGNAGFLQKPYSTADLAAKLRELL